MIKMVLIEQLRRWSLVIFYFWCLLKLGDSTKLVAQDYTEQGEIALGHNKGRFKYSIQYPSAQIPPQRYLLMCVSDNQTNKTLAGQSVLESLASQLLQQNTAIVAYKLSGNSNTLDPGDLVISHYAHVHALLQFLKDSNIIPAESQWIGIGYGIAGHGLIKMAAENPEKFTGVILMDSQILTPMESVLADLQAEIKNNLYTPQAKLQYIDMWRVILQVCKREGTEAGWKEQVGHIVDNHLQWLDPQMVKDLNIHKKNIIEIAGRYNSSSWKSYFSFDPLEHLSLFEFPTLVYYSPSYNPELSSLDKAALEEMIFYLDKTMFTVVIEKMESHSDSIIGNDLTIKELIAWVLAARQRKHSESD